MRISIEGDVLDEQHRPISGLGAGTWCTVLHTNDVRVHLPAAEQPMQRPQLLLVPRRAETLFTLLADTVRGELELSFALRGLPVDGDEVHRVCLELELTPLLDRNPLDLSGGQKAKVAIALALLVNPRVLVIDNSLEPIDRQARRSVIAVLRRAVNSGMRLVELSTIGPSESNHVDEALITSRGSSTRLTGTGIPEIEAWGQTDFVGLPAPSQTDPESTLDLRALAFRYGSGFRLPSIDLSVYGGEVVWLTGPNGAGKTTLLKCLALLLGPQAGRMELDDRGKKRTISFPIGRDLPPIHQHLLYQFQEPDDQIFCATVQEELLATAQHTGSLGATHLEAVALALGLAPHLADSPWNLIRSRRRLLTLGTILCARPRIALLDEPTAELDALERRQVAIAVREYTSDGGACVVVSHDEPFMRTMCTRRLSLEGGTLQSEHSRRIQ